MADAKRIAIGMPLARSSASANGFGSFVLNANNDALVFVVQATEAATVTRLGLRVTTITGTSPTYRISAQGLTTAGAADGTIKGGTNNALKTFDATGLGWTDGEWHWLTLDESFAVTRGEMFAIVIDYSSGTIDGSNNVSFSASFTVTPETTFPYQIQINAGASTRQNGPVVTGWGSVSKAYGRPVESVGLLTFDSGGSPDERAIHWTLPADWGSTYQVLGVRMPMAFNGAGSTVDMLLYTGTTVLQSITLDMDFVQNTQGRMVELYFNEATLETLNFGSAYRLSFQPGGAGDVVVLALTFDAAADNEAWPGGTIFTSSSREDAGAWTDSDLVRISAELILEDITEPASGANASAASGFMTGFIPQTVAPY